MAVLPVRGLTNLLILTRGQDYDFKQTQLKQDSGLVLQIRVRTMTSNRPKLVELAHGSRTDKSPITTLLFKFIAKAKLSDLTNPAIIIQFFAQGLLR